MSVSVKVNMEGHEDKRTSNQSGQTPKWDETFVYPNIHRKSQIEFQVYHKSLFSSEELIGTAIFIFEDLYSYNIKKFISLYDSGQNVGSLHVNLNVVSNNLRNKYCVEKQGTANIAAAIHKEAGAIPTSDPRGPPKCRQPRGRCG